MYTHLSSHTVEIVISIFVGLLTPTRCMTVEELDHIPY